MYVQFDKNKLHIQVICGSKETFTPSPELIEAQDKLDVLKAKVSEFQQQVVLPALKELEDIVAKLNT